MPPASLTCWAVLLFWSALACSQAADEPTPAPRSPASPKLFQLGFELKELQLEGEPAAVTEIAFVPGRPELLLLHQSGKLTHYELRAGEFSLKGQATLPNVAGYDDCGLVSVAFDPAFADNGFVYFGHCTTGQTSAITRYTWRQGPLAGIAESGREIILVNEPNATRPWHNVGAIGFDRTGALWAQFGDKTVQTNAQDLSRNRGKLLRLLPDASLPEGHTPAPDNPLLDDRAADPDVFAFGLRSPWKGAYDARHHRWLVGDVGADGWEELNLISKPLQNFGWPAAEGPCKLNDCSPFTEPLVAFPHTNTGQYVEEDPESEPTTSRAIWVAGPFAALPVDDPYGGRMDGRFLFGDMFAGWVRALRLGDNGVVAEDQHVAHLEFATAWAQGPDGYLYGASFGDYKGHSDDPRARLYRATLRASE